MRKKKKRKHEMRKGKNERKGKKQIRREKKESRLYGFVHGRIPFSA